MGEGKIQKFRTQPLIIICSLYFYYIYIFTTKNFSSN